MDYDINPIKIKVQYSYKDYKEYFKFSRFKGRLYKLRLRLFFINYPIFVGIITFISFINEFDAFTFFGNIALILIYIYLLFAINYIPKLNFKNDEKLFSSGNFFEFRNH